MRFTVDELLRAGSHKWDKKDVDIVILRNLEDLCRKINALGYEPPMRATSCLRSIADQKRINPKAMGSSHCFDTETEILTHKGWKKYKEISVGDDIFSFNMDTGAIENDKIKNIIIQNYTGNMVHISNTRIDICVTDLHELVLKKDNNQYIRNQNNPTKGEKIANSIYIQEKKKPYKKQYAKDLLGKRKKFVVSAQKELQPTEPSFFDLLVCAFICDGFYTSANVISFNFIRQRKINRLKSILDECGIEYKTYSISRKKNKGETIRITNPQIVSKIRKLCGKDKNIPVQWLTRDSNNINALLKELCFYDGHYDNRTGCESFLFTTTNVNNKDIISAMGCLCGHRAIVSALKRTSENDRWKDAYNIYFKPTQYVRHEATQSKNIEYIEGVENKIVWCIQSCNTTLIVRRNGKIFISGNCFGAAADIADADGKLKAWCVANKSKLIECGLWMEDPKYTSSWCHLQIYTPLSMNRYFNP